MSASKRFLPTFMKTLLGYIFAIHILAPLLWLLLRYINDFGYSSVGDVFLDLLWVSPITVLIAFGDTRRKLKSPIET